MGRVNDLTIQQEEQQAGWFAWCSAVAPLLGVPHGAIFTSSFESAAHAAFTNGISPERFARIDLRTNYDYPPIPIRSLDWSAYDDRTYGGEPSDPLGHGATKAEAIADLMEQIARQEDR